MNNPAITLITGLPRSRTAWLAAWLSGGPCFAFHDACADGDVLLSVDDYLAKLRTRQESYVADVSSGLLLQPGIVDAVTGPVIWIRRNAAEARASWIKHVDGYAENPPQSWEVIEQAARNFTVAFGRRTVLDIAYGDLAKPEACEKIWSVVAPGHKFDEQRCRQFQRLNIQEARPWA